MVRLCSPWLYKCSLSDSLNVINTYISHSVTVPSRSSVCNSLSRGTHRLPSVVVREQSSKMRILVAFDFDNTIVSYNSDIVVEKLLPKMSITAELEKLRDGPDWLVYMQEVLNILHKNNVTKDQILKVCADCDSTEGMVDFIKELKQLNSADIIIISDANTVFIEHWLVSRGIRGLVDKIYSNPAKFNSDGLLEVKRYHNQDWCDLSVKNLCKGYVLEAHVDEQQKKGKPYNVVAFVGDGRNDLCPSLKLKNNDLCFPRMNFHLDKIFKKNSEYRSQVKASIHPWNVAQDISKVLAEKLPGYKSRK